jgi:hypothetical protein
MEQKPQKAAGGNQFWQLAETPGDERQAAVCFYDFFHDACFVKPDFGDSRFILEA